MNSKIRSRIWQQLAYAIVVTLGFVTTALAQRQLELLGRGVVAMRTGGSTVYVGWRLLGTDPDDTKFNLYRVTGGVTNLLAANIVSSCNFSDATASSSLTHLYFVQPILNGATQAFSAGFTVLSNAPIQQYLNIPLTPPPGGTAWDGVPYVYNANDCSAGDVDGDGEYEIILKWDPSNSHDNSQSGFTGNTFLDCYKLDGTRLWRLDLGPNIRSGAHYMDFMVYDFDGDGRAELMCRTAPGSRDALGSYVGSAAKWQNANGVRPSFNNSDDYRFNNPNGVTNGYVLAGPEFLSVFKGDTGEELATATWNPHRDPDNNNDNPTGSRINTVWGDSYGNRLDRFLAGVAYCDGIRPSAIFCRGYYTRAYVTAWDWRNGILSKRWAFASDPSNLNYKGQGAHSLSIGDADGDGKDEVLYGAASIDDNGVGHYSTGLGHGDAEHFSDMDPLRPGTEVWMVHETPSSYGPNGLECRDAKTGALIFGVDGQGADVGRGVAYDIDPRYRGYEMWGARGGLMSATGVQISTSRPSQMNFCVWWDADLLRETLDGTTVYKWDWLAGVNNSIFSPAGLASNNSTKSTPCLSADLFGDWREEIIWRTSDNLNLRIYTTTILATNRIYTLMHDPQYRCAIAWQNTGYNQPPHPGFFIGQDMFTPPRAPVSTADLVWRGGGLNLWDAGGTANFATNGVWGGANPAVPFANGRSVLFDLSGSNQLAVALNGNLAPAEVTVHSWKDFTFAGSGQLSGGMKLIKAGAARLTINNTNTFTGATLVSGGTLTINGVLAGSPVTVERRGTPEGAAQISGIGRLGNGLTLNAGATFIVGPDTNAPGLITVTNTLNLQGALIHFDLSSDPAGVSKTNDLIQVYGNLALSGTNVCAINLMNTTLGAGVYPLLRYTGTLSGGLGNLVLTGDFIQPVALTNPPGMIALLATYPSSAPLAPSVLSATTVGAFQINLSWQDNATNETAYVLERSTASTNAFAPLATLSADTSGYADATLAANTTYFYRLRGTNLAGFSAYSNIASNTTTAPPISLAWRGDGVANVWDVGGTLNWDDGANVVVFNNGATATFDQRGSNNTPLVLNSTVQPGAVNFVATKNYIIGGSGVLGGTMPLTKSGSGTFTLNTTNTFSGGVNLNAGILSLGNGAGAGTGAIRFNGGTLTMAGSGQPTYANALVINSNGTINSAGGNNNIVNGAWSGSNVTLNVTISGSGTFTLAGNMAGFPGTVALGNSSGFFRFNGSSGSANTIFDLGTGTCTLNNRNGVTVTLGALTGGSGTFLSGAGAADAPSTYIVGGKNLSTTFNGTIRDASALRIVNLTKVGSGTWTLTGANSYSGTTLVSAGKLQVDGDQSAATGSITVSGGATLGGNGVLGGNTTVSGILSPGTAIGGLSFAGNLTLNSNATAFFEVTSSPLANDHVNVAGNLTLGGTLELVNLSPELLQAGDHFDLFDSATVAGAFSAYDLPTLESGLVWNTSRLITDGTLWVVSTNAPQITTMALTGGNMSVHGSGGTPLWDYFVRSSTNLTVPRSTWSRIATNQFDATGGFNFTTPVAGSTPRAYYVIEVP